MITTLPPSLPPQSIDTVADIESREASSASRYWRFHDEYVLGTRLTVLVNTASSVIASKAADAARREIDRLDRLFNVRYEGSEKSLLNRTRTANASPELFAVAELSEQWRAITRGAFDGRMGDLLRLWSDATPDRDSPDRDSIERSLAALANANVSLDRVNRRIALSSSASLSLDAIAKGYIVDAAVNAARRAARSMEGLAISIGGDIRCWGASPGCPGWRVGIPDSRNPSDNAPLVDAVLLRNAAIATSGRGPRDCIGERYRSTTISPLTGRPARDVMSATVVATHAADADAIATACMVLAPTEGVALAETLGVAARITDARGNVHHSSTWPTLRLAEATAQANLTTEKKSSLAPELRWPADWEIGITYVAPDRNENERSADFRTPYMVLWITDEENRPVNTPAMVGRDPDWQRDNYIWWASHGARAEPLVELRSQATALSGRYRIFWGGLDDDMQPLPIGKYILHLETSQERGMHEYRSIVLEIGRERFRRSLPSLPGSGGLEITYGHYNDRFKE